MKIRNARTYSNIFLAKYGTFHLAVGAAGARAAGPGPGLDMAAAGRALRVRVDRQARRRLGTAAAGASTA